MEEDCSFCLYPESLLDVVAGSQQHLDRFTWRHDTVGTQDAKRCILGTTAAFFFFRLSSNFAGWQNFVFFCFSILTVFGGKMTSQDDRKIKISRYGRTSILNKHDTIEQNVKKIEKLDWNTRFYHPAKFELKRIKNAKVVPIMHFFASSQMPTVDSIPNFLQSQFNL